MLSMAAKHQKSLGKGGKGMPGWDDHSRSFLLTLATDFSHDVHQIHQGHP